MDEATIREMFPASPEMLAPREQPKVDPDVREAFPKMFADEPPPASPPDRSAAPAPDNSDAFRTQVARWGDEARADPEFGGANFDATLADARGVIARYGDDELRAVLNSSGIGNHRSLIRLLARIARDRR